MSANPAGTNPAEGYFRDIWLSIKSIAIGMRITLKYCFSSTVTIQYPYEKLAFAPRFRGIHEFEADKCIACDMCAKACPVDCIYIESAPDAKGNPLLNGIAALALGILVWRGWPYSSFSVLGFFFGINLVFKGAAQFALGFAPRAAA